MTVKWAVHPSSEEAAFLLEAAIIYREARNFQAARDIRRECARCFRNMKFRKSCWAQWSSKREISTPQKLITRRRWN